MMGLDSFGVFNKAAKRGINSSSEAGDLGSSSRNNNNNINKQQSHKSLKKMMMMMVHHHDNHHRPFPHPPYHHGGAGDGPTICTNTNSSRPKSSNIYDVVLSTSDDHPACAAAFGISSLPILNSEISHTTAFKSPAGGMAASLEFPFTIAQWKELERQALIYKYMMASIPVPPDLLFPSIRNPSPAASHCHLGNGLNLRFSGRGDLEPGRCRRTDGKKWRCSRNVAPDQKYCERHMHRGRPRSRKPVELPKKKTLRHTQTQPLPSSPSTVMAPNSSINTSPSPFLTNISHPFHQNHEKSAGFESIPLFTSSFKEPRGLDWMMNRESVSMVPLDNQHWNHLSQSYDQETLSLNSFMDFGKNQEINNCGLFLNHDMVPLEKSVQDSERGFIDLWSSDGHTANPGIKTGEKLSLSSLSLSVGDHIHMGLGVTDSDQNHQECGTRANVSSWLPGGPLAEVLRPSKVAPAATKPVTSRFPL